MKKEFLKNFQVNGAALPDEVVDSILAEHTRALEAAKANPGANGGTGGKTFTQEDVNRIVSERLAREREKPVDDEREKNLKAREARLDCWDYLDSKKYPAKLLDLLDSSDVEKFKKAADAMVEGFPSIMGTGEKVPPYAANTGTGNFGGSDAFANAFKPPKI